ncbi:MAG: hypothetical protein WCI57_03820 [Candidatus Berkelbacteria bacterium]
MTDSNAEDIKQKSKKVDEIFDNYKTELKELKKKKIAAISMFRQKTDLRKMDKIRKEIEAI